MGGIVAEKLYPPTIGSTIPAFYVDQNSGTATLAVPFSMNRAVDASAVYGFRLKIKTVQSNTYIRSLDIDNNNKAAALNSRVATFVWPALDSNNNMTVDFNKIKLGQFLKVQMAYLDEHGNPGYFSTVAITKYTSKPNVFIQDIEDTSIDSNAIPAFKQSYTGVYQTTEDTSERPYEYCFYLFNSAKGLEETSEWKLHNTSVNRVVDESIALDKAIDTYTFSSSLVVDEIYYIQYGVRTINNLEVFSPLYPVYYAETADPTLQATLIPENNFDEAFISLSLQLDEGVTASTEWPETHNYISIEISRAAIIGLPTADELKYANWQLLTKAAFSSYEEVVNWSFRDFTIEQGVYYVYSFKQYSFNGVYSNAKYSNVIIADFEDMFLWDGKRQLKIRFNPKVSSFKATMMEQKLETLGSRYPFIFKNGIVNYKEFPISGLLSYTADNEELFMSRNDDLGIEIPLQPIRRSSDHSIIPTDIPDFDLYSAFESQNMRVERLFKMEALEWLNNGEIKLFKSPAEGNYLVRLMNVSLSPEDKLGRMLHTISATAYEIEELTYSNLVSLGFIQPNDPTNNRYQIMSPKTLHLIIRDKYVDQNTSIRLNQYLIRDFVTIVRTPPGSSQEHIGFYVRIGEDIAANKVYISAPSFSLSAPGVELPNIWFNPKDNQELVEDQPDKAACRDLVGDATITFGYFNTEVSIGSFYGISEITVKNKVETLIGPTSINFGNVPVTNIGLNTVPRILKFWVLDFENKPCSTRLLLQDGKYYDYNNQSVEITHFDVLQLYQVMENNYVRVYYSTNGTSLISDMTTSKRGFYTDAQLNAVIDRSITLSCHRALTTEEQIMYAEQYTAIIDDTSLTYDQRTAAIAALQAAYPPYEVTFDTPPKINLYEAMDYDGITMGWGVYLKAAYQERTVTYNH